MEVGGAQPGYLPALWLVEASRMSGPLLDPRSLRKLLLNKGPQDPPPSAHRQGPQAPSLLYLVPQALKCQGHIWALRVLPCPPSLPLLGRSRS